MRKNWEKFPKKDDVIKFHDKYTGVELQMISSIKYLNSKGIDENDIRRYILKEFYDISDDPEIIKKMLKLRLNYNKKMISIYQEMLKLNYSVLGISKEESEKLSSDIDINMIKDIILKNKQKFIKRNGRFIDLRELGLGVAFIQNGKTNLEWAHSLERLLPVMTRYDVCFLTHGSYNSFTIKNLMNKEFRKECLDFIKYKVEIRILAEKIAFFKAADIDNDKSEKTIERYNLIKSEMQNKYDVGSNDPIFKPKGPNSKWICCPIKTEFAGPFTDINKLITQCIKEARDSKKKYNMIGSKNHIHIYVMSCNPGSIPIDKSITSQKDVHIHYGKNIVMAETTDIDTKVVNDIENDLISFCENVGIDYNDDKYLIECYNNAESNIELLYEMSIKELWQSAVQLAKKVWAAIVAGFKFIVNFIRDLINKIKIAIKNKDAEVQDASFIAMESARIKNLKNKSIDAIQYEIVKSCNNISRCINELERNQINIMRKIDDDLNKRTRVM